MAGFRPPAAPRRLPWFRPAAVTALSAARMFRGTALLLAVTATLTIAALAPVASLFGNGERTVSTRLRPAGAAMSLDGLPIATPVVTPQELRQAAVSDLFGVLSAAGLALFLTAVITLFTLFFARASVRSGEIAVRRAVGASQRLLLAAALLEGVALLLAAMAVGGPVGAAGAGLAAGGWSGTLSSAGWTPALAAGLTLMAVLLGGAELPTLFARREKMVEAEATPVAFFFPALLQLGLCLITLTAGSLLVRHVGRATLVDSNQPGLVYPVENPASDAAARASHFQRLLDTLGATPATAISLTAPGTVLGLGPVARITTNCGQCYEGGIYLRLKRPLATHHFVSPDSFRTLGIRVVAGRGVTAGDGWLAPRVAVVNRALAERHFQNGEAIGRELQVGDDRDNWFTVVGVVEDPPARAMGAGKLPPSSVYLSILQAPPASAELLVRGADLTALRPRITPVRLGEPTPLRAVHAGEAAPLKWFGRWTEFEGWVMVLLAGIGMFALARLWVVSLRPEIGIRRATGARRRHIVGMILGRAAGVGVLGVALGAWFGPAAWLTLPALLPGLPAWDTGVLLAHGGSLVLLMMLGAAFPLWQAVRERPADLIASGGAA